jgi:hypothetical protein
LIYTNPFLLIFPIIFGNFLSYYVAIFFKKIENRYC